MLAYELSSREGEGEGTLLSVYLFVQLMTFRSLSNNENQSQCGYHPPQKKGNVKYLFHIDYTLKRLYFGYSMLNTIHY